MGIHKQQGVNWHNSKRFEMIGFQPREGNMASQVKN